MFETSAIPCALQRLNSIEKCMTVVQLPGGQYAERGSVVNFMSPYIAQLFKKDPYMATVHFQRCYNGLFKFILKGKQKPLGEIVDYFVLGEIVDYFVRLEFQNRGSCYMHISYWIKNIPAVTDVKSAEIAVKYTDKLIITCLPENLTNTCIIL